jgi:hypothetical protein
MGGGRRMSIAFFPSLLLPPARVVDWPVPAAGLRVVAAPLCSRRCCWLGLSGWSDGYSGLPALPAPSLLTCFSLAGQTVLILLLLPYCCPYYCYYTQHSSLCFAVLEAHTPPLVSTFFCLGQFQPCWMLYSAFSSQPRFLRVSKLVCSQIPFSSVFILLSRLLRPHPSPSRLILFLRAALPVLTTTRADSTSLR